MLFEEGHQCNERTNEKLRCIWADEARAKDECEQWEVCTALIETDQEDPAKDDLPIFWASRTGTMTEKLGYTVWIREEIGILILVIT